MPRMMSARPAVSPEMPKSLVVPREVAVIGCGRWGRIIAKELTRFAPSLERIHLVAERNAAQVTGWIAERRAEAGGQGYKTMTVTADLEAVLANEAIETVFVTKMTSQHYAVAARCLRRGKHVFVEKPFVLRAEQARELVQLAEAQGRVLVVGHEYFFAPNIHALRAACEQHLADVRDVHMVWEEPDGATAWGEKKSPDWSSNIVTNLLPHVLSQLEVLFGRQPMSEEVVESEDAYWRATIHLQYGDIPVRVLLDKASRVPQRTIEIASAGGDVVRLDHTKEPGTITVNGKAQPNAITDGEPPRAVPLSVAHFFAQIAAPDETLPTLGANCVSIVEATERVNEQLLARQRDVMRPHIFRTPDGSVPEATRTIMRHHLVGPLVAQGLVNNPKESRALDPWLDHAFRIVHTFSYDPWVRQEQILTQTGLRREELIALNRAIQDAPFLQQLIIAEGLGQKYWKTTAGVMRSGSLDAVMHNRYQFPLRTRIYPGVSCMFFCWFCGRNPSARYDMKTVPPGNKIFEEVFTSIGRHENRAVSVSGGMEPLTNPAIGQLMRYGHAQGVVVSMISNGFMMSPEYLSRQEGLWDLTAMRISLYGVDEPTYYDVTKVKGAYAQVKRSLVTFLTMRNDKNPNLQVGVNFIILKKSVEQVLRVLDLIAEVNAQVTNGRGIDYLTLREDFAVTADNGLYPDERAQLVEVFQKFRARLSEPLLESLNVDYGYMLLAPSQGVIGRPLDMVTYDGLRPKGFPQISAVVDLHGDVFLYGEAGFIKRPGADRYCIGRIIPGKRSFEDVLREFTERAEGIQPVDGDTVFLDAYDHMMTILISQAEADQACGIPFDQGPVRLRVHDPSLEPALQGV